MSVALDVSPASRTRIIMSTVAMLLTAFVPGAQLLVGTGLAVTWWRGRRTAQIVLAAAAVAITALQVGVLAAPPWASQTEWHSTPSVTSAP